MGKLVIFGKNNIVIYNDPWSPAAATFVLDEVIEGVGCVARDSVQLLGDDVVFLSASGLRSLQRTKIQDKMPLTDLSLSVRDEIKTHIIEADMAQVKGQYDLANGIYLLAFPDRNITYAFDFKSVTPDNAPRLTTWNFAAKKNPRSFLATADGSLHVGLGAGAYAGRVATYEGYFDVDKSDVTSTYGSSSPCVAAGGTWETANSKCWLDTENTYQADFKTVWLDFEQPAVTKLLKRFLAVFSGGKDSSVTLNWYRDYSINPDSVNFTLDPTPGGTNFLYGGSTSLYGAAKYLPSYHPTEYKVSLSKAAKVLRLEIIQTVKGFKASLQNMIVWAKQGKIR